MFQLVKNYVTQHFDFPFDIEQIKIDPDQPFLDQLEQLFVLNRNIYSNDEEILKLIDNIEDYSKRLAKLAPVFNFQPHIKANGYWTMLVLTAKCLKITSTPDLVSRIGYKPVLNLFQIVQTGTNVCRMVHENCSDSLLENTKPRPILFTDHLDFGILLNIVQSQQDQMKSLYQYFNFAWLGSMATIMQLFTTFTAIYSSHYKSFRIYNWLSRETRAEMMAKTSLDIHIKCLKSMWGITDFPLVRLFTPSYWHRFLALKTSNVYFPRQQRWIIDPRKPMIHDRQKDTAISDMNIGSKKIKPIRGLYLRTKEYSPEDSNRSLLIHLHGGGFISQSPESHACYLNKWVKNLKNIPILSIDYTLSPEAVFPEAIQEVLDCYLWIISKDPEVKNQLGFYPEKIGFVGDSAGGNFSMALMVVLSWIREKVQTIDKENLDNYRFPDGLFLFYSPFILATWVSPSRVMTSIDGLAPLGSLLNCLEAYLPKTIFNEKDDDDNVTTEKDGKISDWSNYLKKMFKWEDHQEPWYKRKEDFSEIVKKMNELLVNPLISSLLAENIEQFNHIPLYLYPLTFDGFLDDSIEMAKKWQKDRVHLTIIDDVPHGFLNLIDFNADALNKSFFCIEHMLDILN